MRKTLVGLFLGCSLLVSQAQAGLVIATGGAIAEGVRYGRTGQVSNLRYIAMGGIIIAVVGGILGVTGVIADPALTIVLVLDADGNLDRDILVEKLATKFSFIEDVDVIQDLADVIKAKAKRISAGAAQTGAAYVTLTRAEVEEILLPSGADESQVLAVFQELK